MIDADFWLVVAPAVLIVWLDRRTESRGRYALIIAGFAAFAAIAWTLSAPGAWKGWLGVAILLLPVAIERVLSDRTRARHPRA